LLSALLLLLNGCSFDRIHKADDISQTEKNDVQLDTFLEEAVYDFSYEKPKGNPHILINRNGYTKEAEKVAFFVGEQLPRQFSIVDKSTREVVFTGELEDAQYSEESGNYFARGDFTGFHEDGSYYLQAEIIGRSYSFEIKDGLYGTIYDNVLESFYYHRCGSNLSGESELNNHRACHTGKTVLEGTQQMLDVTGGWHTDNSFDKDVVESTKMVSDLLLTYEFLHTEVGSSRDVEEEMQSMQRLLGEVYYEVMFLLKMQDEATGGFYAGVESRQELRETNPEKDERIFFVRGISDEATAECAAILAQFSRVYDAMDHQMSGTCLAASVKAFDYLEKQEVQNDESYYAACELYKTTGNAKYAQYILQYAGQSADAWQGEDAVSQNSTTFLNGAKENSRFNRRIYGDIAYLTTTYSVDMDLCAQLIDRLMSKAEVVSADAKRDEWQVYTPDGVRRSDVILDGAFLLSIIDHIVTSHEYIGVIENQLNYLFGRNEFGENLVTNKGVLRSAGEQDRYDLYLQSSLVFILHELIEREAD